MPEQDGPERQTLSVPEAARWVGLGINTFQELVLRGDAPSVKLGGRRLVPKAALEQWLRDRTRKTTAEAKATGAARKARY